jgi:hypothetical protein
MVTRDLLNWGIALKNSKIFSLPFDLASLVGHYGAKLM